MIREGDCSLLLCRNDLSPSSSILFSLDQTTPFLSTYPCRSLLTSHFFPSRYSPWVHLVLKWSAQTELGFELLSCQGWAVWKDYLINIAGSVPLCALQYGVHLFLWQGVTAGSWQYLRAADQNIFLESFSLSSFLIQCLYSRLFLSKDSPWHLSLWILFFSGHFFNLPGPFEF